MRVVDEMCITFPESDVVVLPYELLCKPLVHTVNIGEWPLLCLLDVTFLCPMHFSSEVRSAKDRPNFTWGFYFRSIIFWPGPHVVDVILEVLTVNEFLDLIIKCDTLLGGVTNVLVESTIFILVPLRAVSTQRVRPFKYFSLLRDHKDVLPR